MTKHAVTVDFVRSQLRYDQATGDFSWLVSGRGRFKRVGAKAGTVNHWGYLVICLGGLSLQAHRLAWLVVTGNWPAAEIDHINGDRSDNRFENLRDVPRAINAQNIRRPRSDSTTGLLGVSIRNGKPIAAVQLGGRQHYLGGFDTPEAAHAAYVDAKRELHEGCTL